jgi:hypothetical protein
MSIFARPRNFFNRVVQDHQSRRGFLTSVVGVMTLPLITPGWLSRWFGKPLVDDLAEIEALGQPSPVYAQLVVLGDRTAIMRRWRPGDTERCQLCPVGTCVAYQNACLLGVPGLVEGDEALLFSTIGLRRNGGAA